MTTFASPHGFPPPPRHAPHALPSPAGITVAGFQALIRDRYYPTDTARGPAGTFLLFAEEVGELATALHDNRPGSTPTPAQRANLEEELVDVLAWLATLANITGVDLEHALTKYTDRERVKGVKPV
ncbi:MAG: nucleotide pyrophosphohydrolase [Phycisphaeraceae bacterium]|nr:MAG: nucleotide pyrophosphohydrolase [Phycisphaeraceae bacterium]